MQTNFSQFLNTKSQIDLNSKGEFITHSERVLFHKYARNPHAYAEKLLTAIQGKIDGASPDEKKNLQQLAEKVWTEYRTLQTVQNKKTPKNVDIISRAIIFAGKLIAPNVKSTGELERMRTLYREIVPESSHATQMGGKTPANVKKQIDQHRTEFTAYGDVNITKRQNERYKELLGQAPSSWDLYRNGSATEKKRADAFLLDLDKKLFLRELANTKIEKLPILRARYPDLNLDETLGSEIRKLYPDSQKELLAILQEPLQQNLNEIKETSVESKISHLPDNDPIKVLARAHMKEIAARTAYRELMPEMVKNGHYNPAIIPHEIRQTFNVSANDPLPPNLKTIQDVKDELRNELEMLKGHLTKNQVRYIRNDIHELMDLYAKAFPTKSMDQAYILGRDALRTIIYQEIHDKGSFTGSDHGSKHVHHNCKNADSLHANMDRKDFNSKDTFVEHLIHMYHDIGYTVGLAASSFDCCKDHPFIGASVIESNKEYFTTLLDNDVYESLQDSILCHAIAIADLTPDQDTSSGFHPNLVRSVTSISDACAVTYDRKTQEFWEQPKAIIALARLKIFLNEQPSYAKILSNPKITSDEWAGLDSKNPLDVLAHDVFKKTKADLLALADSYELAPDMEERRGLFKQAINQQFNAFTANVTVGQYGAILHNVTAVKNDKVNLSDAEYIPQLTIAPSIIYGVIQDLFGQDQAAQAFEKLLGEFGGKFSDIQSDVESAVRGKKHEVTTRSTGVIRMKIVGLDIQQHADAKDRVGRKHLHHLQKGTKEAADAISKVTRKAPFDYKTKHQILLEFDKICKNKGTVSLDAFINDLSLTTEQKKLLKNLTKNEAVEKAFLASQTDPEIFKKTRAALTLALMSDIEYQFMLNDKKANRNALLQQILTL